MTANKLHEIAENGKPPAKITGHRSEKTLLNYIKLSGEENALLVGKHPFFGE